MMIMLCGKNVMTAEAMELENCNVAVVNSKAEMDNISAGHTERVTVTRNTSDDTYLMVTLTEDSWVRFSGSYSLGENDYGQTHVDIYTDSSFSNKKGGYGWGYWEYTNSYCGFLTKGTYYLHVHTQLGNGSKFEGNVNVIVGAIPLSKIFTPVMTTNKKQTITTVKFHNVLGSYLTYAQYQPGQVSLSDVNNKSYWKDKYGYNGSDKCVILEQQGEAFSFQTKENGFYTIMIQDYAGNRYSQVFKVTQNDTKKPTVKGVKNNRTYKKAVKIKFSDNGSGIKNAKLNGKKIKSGKKVSKKGSYKLVVTDKAGNKTQIKFKIK